MSHTSPEGGGWSEYLIQPSNGRYYYPIMGGRVQRVKKPDKQVLYYLSQDGAEKRRFGRITDKCIVDRFIVYMDQYYGKKYTNCAAFAHFLTTGEFIECSPERMFILERGMQLYRDQRVEVGDMLCIIYARDRLLRSRRMQLRSSYLKVKKRRYDDERFRHSLALKGETATAHELREIAEGPLATDFHFLVCAGRYDDTPIWLSQYGRHHPDTEVEAPMFISLGEHDGYPYQTPLLTLIKRRR